MVERLAYLLDLDGTLIDSERQAGVAMGQAVARLLGVEVTSADRDFVIGKSWHAIADYLAARYAAFTWTRDELIAHVAPFRTALIEAEGLVVLPGAHEFLSRTMAAPRALVTGSSRAEAYDALRHLGPCAHMQAVVAAEDVTASKPSPMGYQKAMAALGVAPRQCVVIEDSVAGIAAGRAAGALVVAVRAGNFGQWDQAHAHVVVDSLADVTDSAVTQWRAQWRV